MTLVNNGAGRTAAQLSGHPVVPARPGAAERAAGFAAVLQESSFEPSAPTLVTRGAMDSASAPVAALTAPSTEPTTDGPRSAPEPVELILPDTWPLPEASPADSVTASTPVMDAPKLPSTGPTTDITAARETPGDAGPSASIPAFAWPAFHRDIVDPPHPASPEATTTVWPAFSLVATDAVGDQSTDNLLSLVPAPEGITPRPAVVPAQSGTTTAVEAPVDAAASGAVAAMTVLSTSLSVRSPVMDKGSVSGAALPSASGTTAAQALPLVQPAVVQPVVMQPVVVQPAVVQPAVVQPVVVQPPATVRPPAVSAKIAQSSSAVEMTGNRIDVPVRPTGASKIESLIALQTDGAVPAASASTTPVPAAVPATPPIALAPAAPSASALPTVPVPLATQVAKPLFTLSGVKPGEHVLTINVTPENLGPLTVRAHVTGEHIRVELFAPTELAREALRAILPELRRDLAGGGLNAQLDLSSQSQANDARADAQSSRQQRPPPGMRDGPADEPAPRSPLSFLSHSSSTIDVMA